MIKDVRLVQTNNISKIEALALEIGQESTVDSLNRFIVGWISQIDNKDIGGVGIFRYDDGFIIDYLSPLMEISNQYIIESLINRVIEEAHSANYFPLSIVRDQKEAVFFVQQWGFGVVSIEELPYLYMIRTKNLCGKCAKYLTECVPTVFRYTP